MQIYRVQWESGRYEIVRAKTVLEVVKMFDLATRENCKARIIELQPEDLNQ